MKHQRQIVIPPPQPDVNKRQPLLTKKIGEVAGGTTAECAAVFCCCPCALMHCLVLAFYKVPASLCRKALGKRKRKRSDSKKKALLLQRRQLEDDDSVNNGTTKTDGDDGNEENTAEVVDWDNEMWNKFYGGHAGFWRNPSHRED